jgi:hypothetical protein
MKMVLQENALESWANAIRYSEAIMLGKATLSNRKNFVASLHNAIELFIKQHMINQNDHRVVEVKGIDKKEEPFKRFLLSENLNDFFAKLVTDAEIKKFRSISFNKIKQLHGELFKEFYDKDQSGDIKKNVGEYLDKLQELRNNETHFYIADDGFLSDIEFQNSYNFMIIFYKILKFYKLLPYFGCASPKYERFSFVHEPLASFSYQDQLKNSKFIQELKKNIEGNEYYIMSGNSYSIAQDLMYNTDGYSDADFDELWEYVRVLLKFDMLKKSDPIYEEVTVDDGDDERVILDAYYKYSIAL